MGSEADVAIIRIELMLNSYGLTDQVKGSGDGAITSEMSIVSRLVSSGLVQHGTELLFSLLSNILSLSSTIAPIQYVPSLIWGITPENCCVN